MRRSPGIPSKLPPVPLDITTLGVYTIGVEGRDRTESPGTEALYRALEGEMADEVAKARERVTARLRKATHYLLLADRDTWSLPVPDDGVVTTPSRVTRAYRAIQEMLLLLHQEECGGCESCRGERIVT